MRVWVPALCFALLTHVVGCSDDKPAETEKLTEKSCTEGGGTHASASTWSCADGCNTCSCTDGVVSQTKMACTDADPFQVDSNVPADTSTPADTSAPAETSASDATDDGG